MPEPESESDPEEFASESESFSSWSWSWSEPPPLLFFFLAFAFFKLFPPPSFGSSGTTPSASCPASSAPSAPEPLRLLASAASSDSKSTPSAAFTSLCLPFKLCRYNRVAPSGVIFGLAHPQFSHLFGIEPRNSFTKSLASAMAWAVHLGFVGAFGEVVCASDAARTLPATRAASASLRSISPTSFAIAASSFLMFLETPSVLTFAAASRSPSRIKLSFNENAPTRSVASLKLPQCAHIDRSNRNTVVKVRGLYTGTFRSMCPKCPGQCRADRRQVPQLPCGSIGPNAGSYNPSITGLFSASNNTGLLIFFTLMRVTSSAS